MTKLSRLFTEQGQSPWLDNLKREWLRNGQLEHWIEQGVRGVTSNPTIFQRAIESSSAYDEELAALAGNGATALGAYWTLTVSDVEGALDLLLPLHRASSGDDGFVSLELPPELAHNAGGSMVEARRLHTALGAPNLLIKIPATDEGIHAIRQMTTEGRNINVTLIFSLQRYEQVIEAYLAGLEACDGALSQIRSVASLFVSRIDTEVDRRLEVIGSIEAMALRGEAAIAQAKLAYSLFTQRFSGARWKALRERGAHPQRLLWASTSTKRPDEVPTKYADALIGPMTVNTMPEGTLAAFEAGGTLARSLERGLDEARRTVARLRELGIDLDAVGQTLEERGLSQFSSSFDDLLAKLDARLHGLRSGSHPAP